MESEVQALLKCLTKMKTNNSRLLGSVSNFGLLVEGLTELDAMVEMNEVKQSIIAQIKFLLINTVSGSSNKNFDGHMVHTVLLGPSGCGKTSIGIILAKIWMGIGLLKKIHESPKNSKEEAKEAKGNKVNKMKNDVIKRLQENIANIKSSLRNIDKKIDLNNYRLKTLQRELPKDTYKIEDLITFNKEIKEKITEIVETVTTDENVSFISPLITNEMLEKEIDSLLAISDLLNEKKASDIIKIVSREDLVGGYLGQTAIKTEKLLRDNFGKVIFIDEAYSLVNDEKDSFGKEALTVLNRYMSEYSDSLIIIFAGYKNIMDETIFKEQPGLKRRCSWMFEIKEYSEEGLADIFFKQLQEHGWTIDLDVDLPKFFTKHKREFPNFGGTTLSLAFYCKLVYATAVFDEDYPDEKVINKKILKEALIALKSNRINKEDNSSYNHIYL